MVSSTQGLWKQAGSLRHAVTKGNFKQHETVQRFDEIIQNIHFELYNTLKITFQLFATLSIHMEYKHQIMNK